MKKILVVVAVIAVLVTLLPLASSSRSGSANDRLHLLLEAVPKPDSGKIEAALFDEAETALRLGSSDRETVVLTLTCHPTPDQLSRLRAMGASVDLVIGQRIRVTLPVDQVSRFADLAFVDEIDRPSQARPVPDPHLESLEASLKFRGAPKPENVLGISDLHQRGILGRGVKVAVFESEFDVDPREPQIAGRPVRLHSYSSKGIKGDGGGEHGVGCAQVIRAIAPECELFLVNYEDDVALEQALKEAPGNGFDIISCSMGYLDIEDFGDGSSHRCRAVDKVVEDGVLFFDAAGNCAQNHFGDKFTDPDHDKLHEFDPSDDEGLAFHMEKGEVGVFRLTWDDWERKGQDLDLFLLTERNGEVELVDKSANDQRRGKRSPFEFISFRAKRDGDYFLAIKNDSATPRDVEFHLWVDLEYASSNKSMEYRSPEGSARCDDMVLARGTISIGAVDPFSNETRSYSARGPSADGRFCPILMAPDCLYVDAYAQRPGFFPGTSCSAPVAAGVAALILSVNPDLTPAEVRKIMEQSADDLGKNGPDNETGYGVINPVKAVDLAAQP